jgi:hypothetical protein
LGVLTTPRGSGYAIRLTLTKEMRIALTKLTAQEEAPKDFPLALKALRLGLLCYGVLTEVDLQAMYRRKLITDDEAQFLIENGFVKEDFRPVKSEPLHQAEERRILNTRFGDVIKYWNGTMKESTKIYWLRRARKQPDLPNARRLLALVQEDGV